MMIIEILLLVLIGEILVIILWEYQGIRRPSKTLQRETDLRLTYKRYKELYPGSAITYPEYKKWQARSAYRKAVSSMKIKRMVR